MRRLSPVLLAFLIACGGVSADFGAAVDPPTEAVAMPSSATRYPIEVQQAPDNRPVYQGMSAETVPEGLSLVLMASGDVDVFDSPSATTASQTLPGETILGTTTVLTVLEGPINGWARVLLPGRPNGSTGWVDSSAMAVFVVDGRVEIDLSERTLTYYENGQVVLVSDVAIGTASNPTPTGAFFVTDNVTLADPNSPWGPFALGLSARSETITEYNGGPGIIGIHGTNRPSSIGQAASLGCVRLPNDVITELADLIPIGTPVDIVA